MSIATETMVVSLQVGMWTGHRLDKDASHDVVVAHKADEGAARVNKHLIPKEALAPIVSAAQGMRNHLYRATFPWKDNGDRLLPRKRFVEFIAEHDTLKTEFMSAVTKFLEEDYPAVREQAEFRMGTLFKPEDYPPVSQLQHKFYATLDIDTVTEAGDFRCKIEGEAADRLRDEVTASVERRITGVMQEAWTRLAGQLESLHERLTSEKRKVIREAFLDNLNALVAMLPDMNITGDPNLSAIVTRVQDMLKGVDIKDLRSDDHVKKAVSAEAQEIMENMKGFMTAFGEK